MLIRVAAILLLSTAWAGPAFADPQLGFYAGIYGGPASASDSDFGLALNVAEITNGPHDLGSINDVSSATVDPDFLDFLDDVAASDPSADVGIGLSLHAGGILQLLTAPNAGAVFGYGFGNGLRLEADLSTSSFAVGSFSLNSAGYQLVIDETDDGNLIWDVYMEGDVVGDILPLTDLADTPFSYTTKMNFALANAYYDFDTGTQITPYVGAGVGFAQISSTLNTEFDDLSATAFVPAAQLGAGVRVAVSDPVTLDLGYRLRVAGDPDLTMYEGVSGAPVELRINQSGPIIIHAFQAGLTYSFE